MPVSTDLIKTGSLNCMRTFWIPNTQQPNQLDIFRVKIIDAKNMKS